jgi:hypothetical protein
MVLASRAGPRPTGVMMLRFRRSNRMRQTSNSPPPVESMMLWTVRVPSTFL